MIVSANGSLAAGIPFCALYGLHVVRKDRPESVDFFLQDLPMTPEEIEVCR